MWVIIAFFGMIAIIAIAACVCMVMATYFECKYGKKDTDEDNKQ